MEAEARGGVKGGRWQVVAIGGGGGETAGEALCVVRVC